MYCPCKAANPAHVELKHGISKHVFVCRPMHEGLYTIQYISADLASAPICIPVAEGDAKKTPQPSWHNVSPKKKASALPGSTAGKHMYDLSLPFLVGCLVLEGNVAILCILMLICE